MSTMENPSFIISSSPTSTSTSSSAEVRKINKRLIDRFLQSIRSQATRHSAPEYIHIYMRFWHLYEEKTASELLMEAEEDGAINNKINKNKKRKPRKYPNLAYRYDWLLFNKDVPTIQDRIIEFVIAKKKEGRGANGIENYISLLWRFYRVHGVKGIDWEMIRSFKPPNVKKTHDKEYPPDDIIKIEDKLDVRGKVVVGLMRGSGVRRGTLGYMAGTDIGEEGGEREREVGAHQVIKIGDLFPIQSKFGKIYKIWVYRGSPEMYATACTPEVARKIDDYIEYRMRYGEVCKHVGTVEHMHEYCDGCDSNNNSAGDSDYIVQKSFRADEPHLDPEAPLIREAFDRNDSLAARHPRSISDKQINQIVNDAAVASGVRTVRKGADASMRHKTMLTHGNRKFFKKRCRQAKVDPLILERLMGRKKGNLKEGITPLMMTYDPEEWAEMQAEFEKAIPNLTVTKDAVIQAELDQAKAQLKNVPRIEEIQDSQRKMLEQMQQRYDQQSEELAGLRHQMDKQTAMYESFDKMQENINNMMKASSGFDLAWRDAEVNNPSYRKARANMEELARRDKPWIEKELREEREAVKAFDISDDDLGEKPFY